MNSLFSTTDISVHPDIFSHTLCLYSHISFSDQFVRYSEVTATVLVVLAVLRKQSLSQYGNKPQSQSIRSMCLQPHNTNMSQILFLESILSKWSILVLITFWSDQESFLFFCQFSLKCTHNQIIKVSCTRSAVLHDMALLFPSGTDRPTERSTSPVFSRSGRRGLWVYESLLSYYFVRLPFKCKDIHMYSL